MKYFTLPTTSDTPEAVVLGAGNYPQHALPLASLHRCPFVVCCDGAADDYSNRQGATPIAIVGDGDSLSETARTRFPDRLFLDPTDQETNDQTKGVRYCLAQGKTSITILGATGKREDHTLGNISLLMEYMNQGVDVRMITDYGVFTPASGDATFQCYPRMQVSLFNFGAIHLHGEGLSYPLRPFNNWWQGTLNEATGDQFVVHATGKYLVYRAWDYPTASRNGTKR
ncbi:MAG: thiamine diphosphokinase [Prevotellaceae bacterium]|nr:thiamine diphosphokinase [Prevotellaceae bacterium]